MKIILISLSLLLLFGCARTDMDDLKVYVDEVKQRTPGPIEPIPQIKEAETYLYVAGGRRTPFAPGEADDVVPDVMSSNGITPDFNRRKEELEYYSLDTLRMVGTLAQKEDSWGLVQTKDGTIYRVKIANYMGLNHGHITNITENQIDLIELVEDGSGGYIEREQSLSLGEE